MLQAAVFTLRVLSDDGKVDVGVASGKTGQRFAEDDRGVDVELLAHGDVPGYVARLGYGSEENALESGVCYERNGNEVRRMDNWSTDL